MAASSPSSWVEEWLSQSVVPLPTPPESLINYTSRPPKRRRDDVPHMASRTSSPGKRRRCDDSLPARSATASVAVSERTALTATSSARRTSSPNRQLAELRTARPSVSLCPITMPPKPPPKRVRERLAWLRKQLSNSTKCAYIPSGLKQGIEQMPAFHRSLSMEPIDDEAFDYKDTRTLADPTLAHMLEEVKNIFQSAELCTKFRRDEGAWVSDVFRPLLELVIKLYGESKWRLENVQSQSIDSRYLPYVADRPVARKTDFCFSYSYLTPPFSALYTRLEQANAMPVSHTTDNFTSRVALYSGFEIKPENGDQKEAELQMGIWMAASLRKKAELARKAALGTAFSRSEDAPGIPTDGCSSESQGHDNDGNGGNDDVDDDRFDDVPVEPGSTVIGHEHKVYYAYSSVNEDTAVLGPDEKILDLTTRSPQGIFKLIMHYSSVLRYGGECWSDYAKGIEGLVGSV